MHFLQHKEFCKIPIKYQYCSSNAHFSIDNFGQTQSTQSHANTLDQCNHGWPTRYVLYFFCTIIFLFFLKLIIEVNALLPAGSNFVWKNQHHTRDPGYSLNFFFKKKVYCNFLVLCLH